MLKFCIPCVLSLLVSALYNIVDQIFIGNSELSTLGNAATGVVFPIFIIAQGVAWYFGDGSAAYINIHQGKGDTNKLHKCVGTGIFLTLIASIVLLAVLYPLKTQILSALSQQYFNSCCIVVSRIFCALSVLKVLFKASIFQFSKIPKFVPI